jgi:hypothetical protein
MPRYLDKINIYQIFVEPTVGVRWQGVFAFKPDINDVAAAMCEDIKALDPSVEHEADSIRHLRQTLELIDIVHPKLLGTVSIAGSQIGVIRMKVINVWDRAMPIENQGENF